MAARGSRARAEGSKIKAGRKRARADSRMTRRRSTDFKCQSQLDHGAGHHGRAIQAGPFFISKAAHHVGQRLGRHQHAYACFHYVLEGVYAEASRNGARLAPASCGLLKPPGLPHWNEFTDQASTLRIEYPPESLRLVDRQLPDGINLVSCPSLSRACTALTHELADMDDCSALAAEGLALEILATSVRQVGSLRSSHEAAPPWLRRCEEMLRDGYRRTQRFTHIALELDVSRTHLATAFRAHHGCSMGEFVRKLRVDHVKREIANSNLALAQIAVEAGFADQSHCSRVFRRQTGVTPAQWSRQVRT